MAETTAHQDQLVQGNTAFALNLYHRLSEEASGNLFYSPFSVSTCLAMALLGAKTNTASEMAQCLRLAGDNGDFHAGLARLQHALGTQGGAAGVELRLANSLWADSGISVLSAFLADIDHYYGGGCQQVDFSDSEKACGLINDWVSRGTNGLINQIMSEKEILQVVFVLANAIYFCGKWSTPFEENDTRPQAFHLSSGKIVQADMMSQIGAGWYAEVEGFQILEKWYGDGEFSMVMLLPDRADRIPALEAKLTPQTLEAWLARLEGTDAIAIQVPKFRLATEYRLADHLRNMGMIDAFDPRRADFSGMSGGNEFFVGQVCHKAVLDMEEEGTKAAAVTATTMSCTGPGDLPPSILFRADRPFVFIIRHVPSGTILFLGRLINPAEAPSGHAARSEGRRCPASQ